MNAYLCTRCRVEDGNMSSISLESAPLKTRFHCFYQWPGFLMEIYLPTGHVVQLDIEDFPAICGKRWRVVEQKKNCYCVCKADGHLMLMHREILCAKRGQIIDHKDGNGLNNRRENIRVCTHAQNMRNRRWNPSLKRPAKGVELELNGRFTARITADKKRIYLGCFDTLAEAKDAYKNAAAELHGEFARTA